MGPVAAPGPESEAGAICVKLQATRALPDDRLSEHTADLAERMKAAAYKLEQAEFFSDERDRRLLAAGGAVSEIRLQDRGLNLFQA